VDEQLPFAIMVASPRNAIRVGFFLTMIGSVIVKKQFALLRHYISAFSGAPQGQAYRLHQGQLQNRSKSASQTDFRCAINLWGLPRAFSSLVLPSIERNIIRVNADYNCDYFVHFYVLEKEAAGRSGKGGTIDATQVYQLRSKVLEITQPILLQHRIQSKVDDAVIDFSRTPIVEYNFTTDADFWYTYKTVIDKVRNTVDSSGRKLYYPYIDSTFTFPTTIDNIIKMWHTIQESWSLMEEHERRLGITYDRVAMIRNDVVYVTPLDIFETQHRRGEIQFDVYNDIAVVPGFGRYPVSDRMIYGPRRAVKIWASERFERMDQHAQWTLNHTPGWGLHSEKFVNATLLPAIREVGVTVVEHDTVCFFRARADSSAWVSDCAQRVNGRGIADYLVRLGANKRVLMENLLGRPCGEISIHRNEYAEVLHCPLSNISTAASTAA
jgi:hypothetical protein